MSSLKDKKSFRTEADEPTAPAGPPEVVIGRFVKLTEDGAPLVDFLDNPAGAPVPALATARYGLVPEGASVALMFIDGDRSQATGDRGDHTGPRRWVVRSRRWRSRKTRDDHRDARDRPAMRSCQHGADARRQGAGAWRLCVAALVGDAAHHGCLGADQLVRGRAMNLLNATGMAAHDAMGIHNTSAEKVVAATSASETECRWRRERRNSRDRHNMSPVSRKMSSSQ